MTIYNLVETAGVIIRAIIPILVALAIVAFFWGLVKYIWGQGKDHGQGRSIMIAGLVSLFVMVTLWGILGFAAQTVGIGGFNTQTPLNGPRVNPTP